MKILLDMNLSPEWVPVLEEAGHNVLHWINIGSKTAPDPQIMSWALENEFVVFTHDLDFTHILAATQASGPSVIQVRGEDIMPETLSHQLLLVLIQFELELKKGALVSCDLDSARVRILPL